MPASKNNRRRTSRRRPTSGPLAGRIRKALAAAVIAAACFAAGTQFSGTSVERLSGALQTGVSAAGRVLGLSSFHSQASAPDPASGGAEARSLSGKVVRVADGDTITLSAPGGTFRVRFLGIDAPEHDQQGGQESHLHLVSMVMGRTVTVRYRTTDQYGRIVGKVLADGRDVNLEQLRSGNAWFYRAYANSVFPEDRMPYQKAEREACQARLGLWKDPNPTPPWDFRRNRGKSKLSDFSERAAAPQPEKGFLQRLKEKF
ncbi:thermonuclease family protein [Mesosutterella sp. OilRF-GAM-744-9]|uniref:Thermonuclease family protein n=1 Tax=Mesosutterella porci TaxID=2915351 RepID=A0ABS9MNK4_9BURK|nr:thermonuclease family protein [Mesosutterella sp. oilRF-744-WT-GAM-9]MCG5030122.1 thermonuclease family protein [Mesosutterella sp. oilRF-744-WT-GAM-9]